MKVETGKIYAVLTGDIVGFSRLSMDSRLQLLQTLRDGAEKARSFYPGVAPLPMDIFRGDGWQFLLADPALALRIGLFLRVFLRAWCSGAKADTRFAIGIGVVDFVPGDRVSEGDGEAYRQSGKALETLSRRVRMTLASSLLENETAFQVMLRLADVLIRRLSAKQAIALTGALEGKIQRDITLLFDPPISQQAVASHLEKSGWHAIEEALAFFENNFRDLFSTNTNK